MYFSITPVYVNDSSKSTRGLTQPDCGTVCFSLLGKVVCSELWLRLTLTLDLSETKKEDDEEGCVASNSTRFARLPVWGVKSVKPRLVVDRAGLASGSP